MARRARAAGASETEHDRRAREELLRALVLLRRRRRVHQHRIASFLGITQSAVSDLENGVTDARVSTIQKYARALDHRLDFQLSNQPLKRFDGWRARTVTYSSTIRDKVEDADASPWAVDPNGSLADRLCDDRVLGTRDTTVQPAETDAYLAAVLRAVRSP